MGQDFSGARSCGAEIRGAGVLPQDVAGAISLGQNVVGQEVSA